MSFTRSQAAVLTRRLRETRRFIQAIAGPRQVGKTTLVRQVVKGLHIAARFASADEPTLRSRDWIEQQWEAPSARSGLTTFGEAFKPHRKLLVGGDGISLEAFLSRPVPFWAKRGKTGN